MEPTATIAATDLIFGTSCLPIACACVFSGTNVSIAATTGASCTLYDNNQYDLQYLLVG
jgi:hypothetical protein